MTTARSSRRYELVQWATLVMGLVCLVLIRRDIQIGDGGTRLEAIEMLVRDHTFDDMKYSYVGPILALPFYLLGITLYFNLCVFGVGLVCLGRMLRGLLSGLELRTLLILLVFGSLFPFSTKDFYAETLSGISLGVGSILLVKDKEVAAAPWLVIATSNTPAMLVPVVLLLLFRCYERKSLTSLWIVPATLLVIAADRWVRFHNVLNSGYENDQAAQTFMPFSGLPEFSYPFLLGVVSILFSFGKGILFFCPGLWAAGAGLNERTRRLGRYWLILTLGLILVYAKWWAWYGGQYWGPRFFVFCSFPASLFLASLLASVQEQHVSQARKAGALGLLLVTFWVCLSGLRFGDATPQVCQQNNFALESACWYIPEFSWIFRPLVTDVSPDDTLPWLVPTWLFGFIALAGPIVYRMLKPLSQAQERHDVAVGTR